MQKITLTLLSLMLLTSSLFSSSLIVYNGGIGLVHEQRELNLKKGEKQIIYNDVAKTINTDSVNITLPTSVKLYSQQYRFDKLTLYKLLDAHIGKKVKVGIKNVTLLSHNGSNSIVKTSNNQIISVLSKDIIFSTIPTSLITKPSLVWNIDVSKSIKFKMDINYLIRNISWNSNYILNLHGNKADLSGWITIDNRSGKAYKDTKLHVLAGNINRVQKVKQSTQYTREMAAMQTSFNVSHRSYEGYHFYSVPFNVNLANNEKTQIKFITQNSIPIKRKYNATLSNPLYLNSEISHNVTQYIEIQELKIPLPKGVVRTYSKLKEENILLGESNLEHTPKDTIIKLVLGKNFDIKIKESVENYSDNDKYLDATISYTIKNSSNKKKTIELLIPFNKNSTSSVETAKSFSFKNGNLLSFKVVVEAQKSENFSVRFRSKRQYMLK
ncbi:hypothetical protein [Sulfurimonas sp.]|uniref:DUF4139 domain-containing protein n=1 Tax=Sulfurimonas sp. TaxID=2022749 RepID=UPI002B4A77E9|nr:hypothetical protein [Sulfurimonas sp.]